MMDPIQQLELMQSMGMGMQPGGFMSPTSSGASMLAAMSMQYHNPIAGAPFPNISPLAGMGLSSYGMFGSLAEMAGNAYLTNAMSQQGLMPMGQAGSYMQAMRAREHRDMVNAVAGMVAPQDANGYYRAMRGAAALAGMPFNAQQRQAARSLSQTLAGFGPTLGVVAPEFLDAIAGERGSVQAMASQMMEANRYRVDPLTGRMGFSTASNAALVNGVFGQMFAEDNMAQMRGLRAGDMGQLYRELASEGLLGTSGNTRDQTIRMLQRAREEGMDLSAIGRQQGVAIAPGMNLASLSNSDLAKLRQHEGISTKINQADVAQVSEKLQGYVASLSAMREVFGENGDPNAPMPKLINALKALTSGQMQRFDAGQLNVMVRDMQSMSQLSGKSIDQLLAMSQVANANNAQILGSYGVSFNPTAVRVGATTGMAFAQRGGAVGFGALNREQAEQMSMSLFSRGLGSDLSNTLGALSRIEEAGGFADNAAGNQMRAALAALDSGMETYTYIDANGQPQTARTPTRAQDFRGMVGQGAITGMNMSGFNMMLGNTTSNQRALSTRADRQQAALNQQPFEFNRRSTLAMSNMFISDSQVVAAFGDQNQRNAAGRALGQAANQAIDNMTLAQIQDPAQRNQIIAEALQTAAINAGMPALSDAQAKNMAAAAFGQHESVLRQSGMDATSFAQTHGRGMREARAESSAIVTAQSGLNDAMGQFGPQGGLMQRFMTAMQKQGDRGAAANLQTLLGDMFTADLGQSADKLAAPVQAVQARQETIKQLIGKLQGATPKERAEINAAIQKETAALRKEIAAAREVAGGMGLLDQEGTFNRADVARSHSAAREISQSTSLTHTRMLSGIMGGPTGALITPTNEMIADRSDALKGLMGGRAANISDAQMRRHAEDMLLAEAQLKSIGGMAVSDTLMGGAIKDPALAAAVQAAPPEERAKIVRQYMDRKQMEMYTGPNAQKNREELAKMLDSSAGKKSIGDIENNFGLMSDVRREYLGDAQAVARGGAAGMAAIRQAQEAENDLQALANNYYGGSIGRAVLGSGQGMTEAGNKALEAKFNSLSDPEKALVVNRLKAEGRDVGGIGNLTQDDYRLYIGLKAKDSLGTMRNSMSGLAGAASGSYADMLKPTDETRKMAQELMGAGVNDAQVSGLQALTSAAAISGKNMGDVTKGMDLATITQQIASGQQVDMSKLTPEQQAVVKMAQGMQQMTGLSKEQIGSLTAMSRMETADVNQAAAALGLTPEQYLNAVRTGSMEGVANVMDPEKRKQALQVRGELEGEKSRLAQLQAQAARQSTPDLVREIERTQDKVNKLQGKQNKLMNEQGLDSSKAEDVKRYNQQLDSQGHIQQLQKQQAAYQAEKQKLKASGMTDAEADKALSTMRDQMKATEKQVKEAQARDMGSDALNVIADAFGEQSTENRQKFREQMSGGGATDQRNQAMVAGVLSELKGNDKIGGKGVSAIAKLDILTDEYALAKTTEQRKELAAKYGMSLEKLDSTMERTRFLGLEGKDPVTTEGLAERFKAVRGQDLESEARKKEENTLTLRGVLELTGLIKGQGTLNDTTAVGGAR